MSRESIRQRLEAATPGPWFHYKAARLRKQFAGGPVDEVSVGPGGPTVVPWIGFDGADGTKKSKRANAAFIAHARQDIPALLAVADAAAAVAWQTGGTDGERLADALAALEAQP
jgi:hypothetical protein